ncbi:DUF397 domain-containing protein [Streptomyces sp. YIM 130001]|uniref:DUF397 domain-containing protein n=1 Tax=Streptomyces sp. YIM 130001 TaxID=2259644 RepID=UPI000E64818F|nr:DUF397 domain-containing protein [Streptomyces sp. YIM 130001]
MERTTLPEPRATTWRKSSYSNQAGGDCVEVADGLPHLIPVRDSKVPHGAELTFGRGAWSAFISAVRRR